MGNTITRPSVTAAEEDKLRAAAKAKAAEKNQANLPLPKEGKQKATRVANLPLGEDRKRKKKKRPTDDTPVKGKRAA